MWPECEKPTSLCMDCSNSVPSNKHGCEWSMYCKPVPGWDAVPTKVYHRGQVFPEYADDSYLVKRCPKFVKSEGNELENKFDDKITELTKAVIRQAIIDRKIFIGKRASYITEADIENEQRICRVEDWFRSGGNGIFEPKAGTTFLGEGDFSDRIREGMVYNPDRQISAPLTRLIKKAIKDIKKGDPCQSCLKRKCSTCTPKLRMGFEWDGFDVEKM